MKTITVFWEGTVTGTSDIEVEDNQTIEDAMKIAMSDDYDGAVEIEYYPEDWAVNQEDTIHFNRIEGEHNG